MDGGVVVEQGPPRSVIDNPEHERTRTFLQRMRSEHQEHHAHVEHHEGADDLLLPVEVEPESEPERLP
jgi:polar amino acid transport system ATP-binding protein